MEPRPGRRILCAEDNEDICFVLTTLLGREAYEVTSADTFAKALGLALSARFDLYVLDNHFPDGNGLVLCRRIREFDAHAPIIFYTGAAFESDKDQALGAGADAYIVKPGIDEIVDTIKQVFNRQRPAETDGEPPKHKEGSV
ncbi:MAG: response regulator [Pyrinomonadaceae bacterium]